MALVADSPHVSLADEWDELHALVEETTGDSEGPARRSARPSRRRSVARVGIFTVIVTGLVVAAYSQRSTFAGVPESLEHAHPGWALLALVVGLASLPMLAAQERGLLAVGGTKPGLGMVLSTNYVGNAISLSIPVVGSELSVAYAYKRFASHGVREAVAAWALVMSGIVSTTAFVALTALGALTSGNTSFAIAGLVTLATVVAPGLALVLGLRSEGVRTRLLTVAVPVEGRLRRVARREAAAGSTPWIEGILTQIGTLHAGRATIPVALAWSLVNWAADIACLAFALETVGAPVPWRGLVLAWAAGAGVSTLGLTPGGFGVVEVTLALALVGAGVPHIAALSAVVVYRLISAWLLLAGGWATFLFVDRAPATTSP